MASLAYENNSKLTKRLKIKAGPIARTNLKTTEQSTDWPLDSEIPLYMYMFVTNWAYVNIYINIKNIINIQSWYSHNNPK